VAPVPDPTSSPIVATSTGATASASPAREPPATAVRDDGRKGRQTGERFRAALARGDASAGPGSGPAVSASALGSWLVEPSRPATPPCAGAAGAGTNVPRAVDRILIGGGGEGAEARIRIASGALAGSEIRLLAAAGRGSIDVELLTSAAGSRQTLVAAMDEIRRRLRGKGITLSAAGARQVPGGAGGGRRGMPGRRSS